MTLPEPYYDRDGQTVYLARCEDVLPTIPDQSVDLVLTDPPYFRVKDEPWDRQWKDREAFLHWIGDRCDEWRRVLKPNGTLAVFASPDMAWFVEREVRERFNVLNSIRWVKDAGWHNKTERAALRSFLSPWEAIILAEQFGADATARGEGGYAAKCDELRGFVFEPIRTYLAGERDRAGWTTRRVAEEYQKKSGSRTVTGMAGHWFERVQWVLPTEDNYQWLRELFNARGGEYLRREYEDLRREYEDLRREYEDLRREYEDLRREYEDLRRPFTVGQRDAATDVVTFPTVQPGYLKHPCEKPLSLIEYLMRTTTKPGALVLDPFVGSGTTLEAARNLGRRAIGIDTNRRHCDETVARLAQAVLPFDQISA